MSLGICAIDGCEQRVRVKIHGLCGRHYKRLTRHGDPTAGAAYAHEPIESRIRRFSRENESGRWIWRLALNANGYGIIGVANRSKLAHRASFEAFIGPVPEGLELDHVCKTKACVNPAHLEAVTRSENVRRGWPDRKKRETCR